MGRSPHSIGPAPRRGSRRVPPLIASGAPPLPSASLCLLGVSLSSAVSPCCHFISWAARPSSSQQTATAALFVPLRAADTPSQAACPPSGCFLPPQAVCPPCKLCPSLPPVPSPCPFTCSCSPLPSCHFPRCPPPPSRICHSASRSPRHRVPAPALPLAVRAQVGVARGTKKARPGDIAARPRGRGGSPVPAGSV